MKTKVRKAAEEWAPAEERETVLLVEGDDSLRALARSTLQQGGYEVLEAQAPEECCVIAGGHPSRIHLVVTESIMSGMSGRDLVESLASVQPGMKVLYVSGRADDAIVPAVLDPGAEFLEKPFTPSSLIRKVREILSTPPKSTK